MPPMPQRVWHMPQSVCRLCNAEQQRSGDPLDRVRFVPDAENNKSTYVYGWVYCIAALRLSLDVMRTCGHADPRFLVPLPRGEHQGTAYGVRCTSLAFRIDEHYEKR